MHDDSDASSSDEDEEADQKRAVARKAKADRTGLTKRMNEKKRKRAAARLGLIDEQKAVDAKLTAAVAEDGAAVEAVGPGGKKPATKGKKGKKGKEGKEEKAAKPKGKQQAKQAKEATETKQPKAKRSKKAAAAASAVA